MPSRSDLEAMSSPELHDLAMRRALHHADFGFLWQLLRELPAAEAAEGNPGRTGADLYRISALISDALGRSVRLRIAAAALRSVEHRGGLDNFLVEQSDGDLSSGAVALKREIVKKRAEAAAAA